MTKKRGKSLLLALNPFWSDDLLRGWKTRLPDQLMKALYEELPTTRLFDPEEETILQVVTQEAPELLDFYSASDLEEMQTELWGGRSKISARFLLAVNPLLGDTYIFLLWLSLIKKESNSLVMESLRFFFLHNVGATAVACAIGDGDAVITSTGDRLSPRRMLQNRIWQDSVATLVHEHLHEAEFVRFLSWFAERLEERGAQGVRSYVDQATAIDQANSSFPSEKQWLDQLHALDEPTGLPDDILLALRRIFEGLPSNKGPILANALMGLLLRFEDTDSFLAEAAATTRLAHALQDGLGLPRRTHRDPVSGVATPVPFMMERVL